MPILVLLLIGLPIRIVVLHKSSFDLESTSTYVYIGLFIVLSIVACLNMTIDLLMSRQSDQKNKIKASKQSAQFKHILNGLPAGCMFVNFVKKKKPVEFTMKDDLE